MAIWNSIAEDGGQAVRWLFPYRTSSQFCHTLASYCVLFQHGWSPAVMESLNMSRLLLTGDIDQAKINCFSLSSMSFCLLLSQYTCRCSSSQAAPLFFDRYTGRRSSCGFRWNCTDWSVCCSIVWCLTVKCTSLGFPVNTWLRTISRILHGIDVPVSAAPL